MKRKAENAGPSQSECLECPVCLENFKSPTLLSCGHTFCKVCLDKYDQQHLGQKYMQCPVCKKRTKLGSNRIDGLVPNFSMIGLCEDSPSKATNPQESTNKERAEYCSLHRLVYNDILCENCKEFICLTCFLDKHQGHTFKKKEELDSELTKKRDSLLLKSDKKKAEIQRSISDVEQQIEDMQSHLEDVANEIKNSHRKMVKVLSEKRNSLLHELSSIEDQSSTVCEEFIARQRKFLQMIQKKSEVMAQEALLGPCNITDPNAIKARYVDFLILDKEWDRDLNNVLVLHTKQRVSNIRFREAPDTSFEIGYVDQDIRKSSRQQRLTGQDSARDLPGTSGIQDLQVKTGNESGIDNPQEIIEYGIGDQKMDVRDLPGTSRIHNLPAPGQKVALAISNEIVLPASISGLAAAPSKDAVMVSYGQKRDGVDFFYDDGRSELRWQRRPLGPVSDIAFLSDGRLVTLKKDECKIHTYHQSGYFEGSERTFKCSISRGNNAMLCTDREDKIYRYAFDSSNISVFDARSESGIEQNSLGQDQKLLGCANRICITKKGTIISACGTSTYQVVAYVKSGSTGELNYTVLSKVHVASDDKEHFCIAVDSRDRLLIARVKDNSDSFSLTRYIIRGSSLFVSRIYKLPRLPHVINPASNWCYLVSVNPNLIAFANGCHLYFMHLGI